jgi:hypothetical protein
MPSTYSPLLRLELIGNGEQAGTWGTTTNNNLGALLDQAIAGVQSITLTGGDYTLTDFNGLPDESRNAVLVLGGLLGAPCNVIAPPSEKVYIVRNFSNATVTIKTAAGNGVSLTNAASAVVFCDGTDFYSATTLNYIDGNLTVTGTTNLQGAVTTNSTVSIGGNVTITSNTASIFANASSGQVFLPVGTDAQRSSTPTNGLIRYNEEQNFYEGYANSTWVRFLVANQGAFTLYYLLVGGGGGAAGPGYVSGGGGAGQMLENSVPTSLGTVFTITVGAGGAGAASGSTTTLSGVTSAVGGGASNSGSGATSGNGFGGGAPFAGNQTSGGGGGAGGSGGAGQESVGGFGGIGLSTNITGTSTYYGGGGSGSGQFGGQGGGLGGGGAAGGNGTVNTGGGAGGTISSTSGGSGRVTIKVETLYYSGTYTGTPTITTIGDFTCLTYTASGTYTA